MPTDVFASDVRINGNLTIGGTNPQINRSDLVQESLAKYAIPWTDWRIWDAFHTNLPGTPLTDDLGLVGGTFATNAPSLQTEDLKAAGATNNYARCMATLPPEYVAGETVQIRFEAGMKTTVSDTTATLDCIVHESDLDDTVSADLVTTGATTMNNTLVPTMSTIDFTVTATALAPGDILDIRIQTAINDGASGTAVIGFIGGAWLLCDIKG